MLVLFLAVGLGGASAAVDWTSLRIPLCCFGRLSGQNRVFCAIFSHVAQAARLIIYSACLGARFILARTICMLCANEFGYNVTNVTNLTGARGWTLTIFLKAKVGG